MGTVVERYRKNGSVAFLAQISLMREGKIVHRESRTFDRRPAANVWLKKREKELDKPDAIFGAKPKVPGATLAEAIDRYIADSSKAMGKTKTQVLRTIKTYDIADKRCADITSQDYLAFAQALASDDRLPQTVENYLSHLGAVVSLAQPAWGFALDPKALTDGRIVAKSLGVTSKGGKRSRRPTLDELDRLLAYFIDRKKRLPTSAPMTDIIVFAIFSTRRLDESKHSLANQRMFA